MQSLGGSYALIINNDGDSISMADGKTSSPVPITIPAFLISLSDYENRVNTYPQHMERDQHIRIVCTETALALYGALGVKFYIPPDRKSLYVFRDRLAGLVSVFEENTVVASRVLPAHMMVAAENALAFAPCFVEVTIAPIRHSGPLHHLLQPRDAAENGDQAYHGGIEGLTSSERQVFLSITATTAAERLFAYKNCSAKSHKSRGAADDLVVVLASHSVASFHSYQELGAITPTGTVVQVTMFNLVSTTPELVTRFHALTGQLLRHLADGDRTNTPSASHPTYHGVQDFLFFRSTGGRPNSNVSPLYLDVVVFKHRGYLEQFQTAENYEKGLFSIVRVAQEQREAYITQKTVHVFQVDSHWSGWD